MPHQTEIIMKVDTYDASMWHDKTGTFTVHKLAGNYLKLVSIVGKKRVTARIKKNEMMGLLKALEQQPRDTSTNE